MAISYTVKIKGKKLKEQIVTKAFEDLGFKSENIETLPKGVCIDFFSELGFYVYLTDASNFPYNSWITNFYEEEFIFDRTLQFRFDKEYKDIEQRYAVMLSVVFGLISNLGEEAIFISNDDTEICLFKENGEILLNKENEFWYSRIKSEILA